MVNGSNWGKLLIDLNLGWFLGHRGWLPTLLILALLACFLCCLVRLTRRQRSALGRILCGAVTATLAIQTAICVACNFIPAANLVLVPFGLPFLTYGAYMSLYHVALCSTFLGVCRSNAVLQDEKAPLRGRRREKA